MELKIIFDFHELASLVWSIRYMYLIYINYITLQDMRLSHNSYSGDNILFLKPYSINISLVSGQIF